MQTFDTSWVNPIITKETLISPLQLFSATFLLASFWSLQELLFALVTKNDTNSCNKFANRQQCLALLRINPSTLTDNQCRHFNRQSVTSFPTSMFECRQSYQHDKRLKISIRNNHIHGKAMERNNEQQKCWGWLSEKAFAAAQNSRARIPVRTALDQVAWTRLLANTAMGGVTISTCRGETRT